MRDSLLRLVPDLGGDLIDADYEQALLAGLVRYSTDVPAHAKYNVTGDGPWPAPSGWWRGSRITALFNLADNGEMRMYSIYSLNDSNGRIERKRPGLPQNLTISYTRLREGGDVPAEDKEAVLNWAAAYLLDMLATRHTGDLSSSIASDSVDHKSKGADFAARANACRALYFNHLGIDPKKVVCAGAIVTVKPSGSSGFTPIWRRGSYRQNGPSYPW